MFSKAESKQIKKEFWIQFAQEYPRKWLLYHTKIKDFAFKFYVDNKKAMVLLDIEPKDDTIRMLYYDKVISLQTILLEHYLPEALFEKNYTLENQKTISRVSLVKNNVSVNNKATWHTIFDFFYQNMNQFELFFYEFEDYIKAYDLIT